MKKLALLILFPVYTCFGQQEFDYNPLQTKLTEDESKQLRKEVSSRLKADLKEIDCRREKQVKEIYEQRTEWLLDKVSEGSFVYDPIVLDYFDSVLKNILDTNPGIKNRHVRIMINRSPTVNAYCTGESTLIFNLGLLRRIENESQLAFVIAHELAHQELDHVYKGILSRLESFYGKGTKQKEKEIRKSDRSTSTQMLELYKEILYSELKHKRSFEIEADSLGQMYLANTAYDQQQVICFLHMLDSADYPKYPNYPRIDSVFNFSNFPFDPIWLHDEDSLFDTHFNSSLIFDSDSVKTHPDIEERISSFQSRLSLPGGKVNLQQPSRLEWIVRMSDFEAIESAYFTEDYSQCLFLTLQALSVYKDNSYLHGMIGRIFIDLFEMGDNPVRKKYMFRSSSRYHAGLRQIRTFLKNLKQWEIGEIALNYMNTRDNFDPQDESHYFVLWKIGQLINNQIVMEQVQQAYTNTFPSGRFITAYSENY